MRPEHETGPPTELDPRPDAGPVLLHRRSLEYDAFDADGAIAIVGRLSDRRPWAEDGSAVSLVHDMELRVVVGIEDMTIRESEAIMHVFPHEECPSILEASSGLVGLSVSRGFTREVQARFGGPRGCTHLEQLARSLGPVAIQAVMSRRARAVALGEAEDIISGTSSHWARSTCHVWTEGGIAEQKLAAGWRPGVGPYPSPVMASFLRPTVGG